MRYGVQVITHIEKTGNYDLKISNKQMLKEEDKKTFSIDVENQGTLYLAPEMSVELFDSKGSLVGKFKGKKIKILPTCSVKYSVDLTEVKEGIYKAIVVLDHSENDIFGAEYTLSL